jgi:hypothetical protein
MKGKPPLAFASQAATGPRTVAGKKRSSRNAIKHGLFCQDIILEGEERADFDDLLRDLIDDRQPEGAMEHYLVNQLATLMWRRRRVIVVENALISRAPEFLGLRGRSDTDYPRQMLLSAPPKDITAPITSKAELLYTAAKKLWDLRHDIEAKGLDFDRILEALYNVYGFFDVMSPEGLSKDVLILTFVNLRKEQQAYSSISSEILKAGAMHAIYIEAERLFSLAKQELSKEVIYNSVASLLPKQTDLDRILRYETHLSREIDRTLFQLDRLQNARRNS